MNWTLTMLDGTKRSVSCLTYEISDHGALVFFDSSGIFLTVNAASWVSLERA